AVSADGFESVGRRGRGSRRPFHFRLATWQNHPLARQLRSPEFDSEGRDSMPFFTDLRVGLRLSLRARFISLSTFGLVALFAAAALGASFSGRQPATVALDVGLSVIRFVLPIIAVFMLQEL